MAVLTPEFFRREDLLAGPRVERMAERRTYGDPFRGERRDGELEGGRNPGKARHAGPGRSLLSPARFLRARFSRHAGWTWFQRSTEYVQQDFLRGDADREAELLDRIAETVIGLAREQMRGLLAHRGKFV